MLLSESHGMIFQSITESLQDVALGTFNAFVDVQALKTFGIGNPGGLLPRAMGMSASSRI